MLGLLTSCGESDWIQIKNDLLGRRSELQIRRHDLRATFCTRLALAGYDAFTIKALMGHRDIKTTERYIRAHRLTRQIALVEKSPQKPQTKYGRQCWQP